MNSNEVGRKVEQTFFSDIDSIISRNRVKKWSEIRALLPPGYLATIVSMHISSEQTNDRMLELESVIKNMPKLTDDKAKEEIINVLRFSPPAPPKIIYDALATLGIPENQSRRLVVDLALEHAIEITPDRLLKIAGS